jgi:hypothetical protein
LAQQVFDRKPAAPALSEGVAAIKAQLIAHFLHFIGKTFDRPKPNSIGFVRFSTAELIIENHRAL